MSCGSVTVVTNQASPYRVEFMDAVKLAGEVDLRVVYLYSQRPGRHWRVPVIRHQHCTLDRDATRLKQARVWVRDADFAVLAYYQDPMAAVLLSERATTGRAWCFWGERTGVTRWAVGGPLYRRWKLRALHQSHAAIWGIGEFALERFRREFGFERVYCNVPYFSNLSRFGQTPPTEKYLATTRTILYSGSLIARKGVDLLAEAFACVAPRYAKLRLVIMGVGELSSSMMRQLYPVSSQVEFVGYKDWDTLPIVYAKADVLCAPSRHDGWALVVPEALASGLPVIGTDQMGAVLHLIDHGQNGWRIQAGKIQPLRTALEEVATMTDIELARMSRAAHATAANHSLEAGVARFHHAIEQSLVGWG